MNLIPEYETMTEEEYLKSELDAEFRHEYIDGRVYQMPCSNRNHNLVTGNLLSKFHAHLENTTFHVFAINMKLQMGKDYVYPDVVVDGGKMQGDDYFCKSPVIIVEVISGLSRKRDLALKFPLYIKLPSVEECIVIETDTVSVNVNRKSNFWRPDYYFLGDAVTLPSIGLTLSVEEIYKHVDNEEMQEFRQLQSDP
jgi:Uma2 family endonuclease